MFCPKCGKPIPEGGRFCGSCGAAVQQSAPKEPAKPPRKKKKLPLKKMLIPVLCLALVAAVFFGVSALFGKKTMYLVSRSVSGNPRTMITTRYEYDDQGRQISMKRTTKYLSGNLSDFSHLTEYTYDEAGKYLSVEIREDGESYELEYNYDKKGNLKSIECDDREAEVEYGKDGLIEEISWDTGSVEFSYYKNGAVKEYETYSVAGHGYIYTYDESGNLTKSVQMDREKKMFIWEYIYDSNGRLVEQSGRSLQDNTHTYFGVYAATEVTTTYHRDKSGLPEQIVLSGVLREGEITLYLETEDDGLERDFYVVDIEADRELLEAAGAEDTDELLEMLEDSLDGDAVFSMEFDKYGNQLESIDRLNETESSSEYIAVKVPRDYCKPGAPDPLHYVPPIY